MTDFHEINSCLECERCHLLARKVVPSGLFNHPKLGRMTKYSLSRNAKATIIEALNPLESKLKILSSIMNINDSITGEAITVITQSLKPIRFKVVNLSGRHKAHEGETIKFTYANIKYPLENVLNAYNKKTINS